MSQINGGRNKVSKSGKRATNACTRCRQQKIKCSGVIPCQQCSKRGLSCTIENKEERVLVSRDLLDDLQRRVTVIEHVTTDDLPASSNHTELERRTPANAAPNSGLPVGSNENPRISSHETISTSHVQPDTESEGGSPRLHLVNPLAGQAGNYISDSRGIPCYLGTSSNWSFGRRVLSLAHESILHEPFPIEDSNFDGKTYDLGWDGFRDTSEPNMAALPSSDFAVYLINAVKFHCGQMFHLFDEESFMTHFTRFHQSPQEYAEKSNLWFVHYLLILAFGKAFIVRSNAARHPPGADMFVWAMKSLPDTTLLCSQSVESVECVEILCCVALYLQCLDFRSAAFNFVGQALRIALNKGFHTSMDQQDLPEPFIQRCRSAWWTAYVLDRQMSSLLGVPLSIRDEDVSAPLPGAPGLRHRTLALEMHVSLSRVISQILNTVYGADGRLSRKFIQSTKAALKSIAAVTDQLNRHFEIPASRLTSGISRLSAYLHLLYHQSVVLATRPLLFTFFKMRLDAPDSFPLRMLSSDSARILLHMCVESSQQILDILKCLQTQSLLESFLPFDLEAAFTASLVAVVSPAVDTDLMERSHPCLQTAYYILDEMIFRGNVIAAARKSDLAFLENLLDGFPFGSSADPKNNSTHPYENYGAHHNERHTQQGGYSQTTNDLSSSFPEPETTITWNNEMTTQQLLTVAESLDLDGIDWMTMTSSNFE